MLISADAFYSLSPLRSPSAPRSCIRQPGRPADSSAAIQRESGKQHLVHQEGRTIIIPSRGMAPTTAKVTPLDDRQDGPVQTTNVGPMLARPHLERTDEAPTSQQHPEMWVMPITDFFRLSSLQRSHEELRSTGKLVHYDPVSMRTVFYLSSEWTSLWCPDHSRARLHAFQALVIRMIRGELPHTAPAFTDAVRLPNSTISPAQWQGLVRHAYVWMDFISVS